MIIRESPAERFWRFVKGRGSDGCWLWTGATRGKGYGAFSHKIGREPKVRRQIDAHRFSWELHRGPIPVGLHVCHHCDTPACVNPGHLFVGTAADNQRDKSAKGRNPGNPTAKGGFRKVTPEQAAQMRALSLDGHPMTEIGAMFGVSPATVCRNVRLSVEQLERPVVA